MVETHLPKARSLLLFSHFSAEYWVINHNYSRILVCVTEEFIEIGFELNGCTSGYIRTLCTPEPYKGSKNFCKGRPSPVQLEKMKIELEVS